MWMAEWLFTDFFERAVTATRRSDHDASAFFGPGATFDSDRADDVEQRRNCERDQEQHSEEQFRGNQLANEVHLQHEENRQAPASAIAERLVLPESRSVLFDFS